MFGLYRRLDPVDRLIARGSYPRAIQLLERQIDAGEHSVRQIQQLAALYERVGSSDQATDLLLPLVDRFAEAGFVAKAIAVLKRIERLDPGQEHVEARLAELIRRRQIEIDGDIAGRQARSGPTRISTDAEAPPIEVVRITEPGSDASESQTDTLSSTIERSPLFSGFSSEELAALIHGLGLYAFEGGQIVLTEGEPGDSLYILASGTVRVYARDDKGRNHQIRVLRPPQFFGEVSLFEASARTATVVAATDCELLRLDRTTLEGISATHPEMMRTLQRAYAQRAESPEELEARGEIELPI